jgi:hypothetical protein
VQPTDDAYAVRRVGRGKVWWEDAQRRTHRADGPAVEWQSGVQEWYWHGVPHRMDGPAVIKPGLKRWYRNGKLHREDGPAVEEQGREEWYRNGRKMTPEQIAPIKAKLAQTRAGEELATAFKTGLDRPIKVRAIKRLKKKPGS